MEETVLVDSAIDKIVFIDVETPNGHNDSICSIGAILTELDGTVLEEFYSLVNPEAKFWSRNMAIHKIEPEDVEDSPTFGELWSRKLSSMFENARIVAHNNSFDMHVLAKTFETYNIALKDAYVADSRGWKVDLSNPRDALMLGVEGLGSHHALIDAQCCKAEFFYNYGDEHINEVYPHERWKKFDFRARKFLIYGERTKRWF